MVSKNEPIPLFLLPRFTWRLTRDDDNLMLIETINSHGVTEQEIFCTVSQARALGRLLRCIT